MLRALRCELVRSAAVGLRTYSGVPAGEVKGFDIFVRDRGFTRRVYRDDEPESQRALLQWSRLSHAQIEIYTQRADRANRIVSRRGQQARRLSPWNIYIRRHFQDIRGVPHEEKMTTLAQRYRASRGNLGK
jgi:hypothetical protein